MGTMMSRIWSCFDDDDPDSLQKWPNNIKALDLTVNHRSGEDAWYSTVINMCRSGSLDWEDWRFLHGAPTSCCVSWLTASGTSICGVDACGLFARETAEFTNSSPSDYQARISDADAPS